MDGTCKMHGKLIMQTQVWSNILRDRNHFEKLDVEGMMLTLTLKKKNRMTTIKVFYYQLMHNRIVLKEF